MKIIFKSKPINMNKTAMQEMLEWVRATFPMDLDTPRMIEEKIEFLLQKEKQQIIEAHKDGFEENVRPTHETSEQYYNEKFNKNK